MDQNFFSCYRTRRRTPCSKRNIGSTIMKSGISKPVAYLFLFCLFESATEGVIIFIIFSETALHLLIPQIQSNLFQLLIHVFFVF